VAILVRNVSALMSFGYREIRNILLVAMAFFPLSLGGSAVAQACDCTVKRPGCAGTASVVRGHWIHLTASTNQCAFVVYKLNGYDTETTVEGGSFEEEYMGMGTPAVSPNASCWICESEDARGVKIDPHPTGRTNPNMNEIHQDTLKLLRGDKGS